MSTAIGTYATLAQAKLYLVIGDTADDVLLQSLCDRVNMWVERTTGRYLAPYPLFNTTVSSGGTVGSTSVTLASATGLNVGDEIMFGPVAGTHESTEVLAIAGAVVTLKVGLVAAYAGGVAVSRVAIRDASDCVDERTLLFPQGIVTLGALEIALYTGGPFYVVPSTDWKLRPSQANLTPGYPFTELQLVDVPSAGNLTPVFNDGYDTVRLSGQTLGWPAIPDDITDLANRLVANLFLTRGAAGGDPVSVAPDGSHVINRLMSSVDWATINAYRIRIPVLV